MKSVNEAQSSEREKNFAINQVIAGRSNAVVEVTLMAGAASTPVEWRNGNAKAAVLLSPMTANAAAALATTYIPAATLTGTGFVIQHANNAQTDRTFRALVIGG